MVNTTSLPTTGALLSTEAVKLISETTIGVVTEPTVGVVFSAEVIEIVLTRSTALWKSVKLDV